MYARVLRKWSLAKFLMNLWLVVMMLLVIWCPNATSMYLMKNTQKSSFSALSSNNQKSVERNSNLDSTMTIYDPYRSIDSSQSQQQELGQQLYKLRRQRQQLKPKLDAASQAIFIRTNANTAAAAAAQVDNVPNLNSQIINLNSNYVSATYNNRNHRSRRRLISRRDDETAAKRAQQQQQTLSSLTPGKTVNSKFLDSSSSVQHSISYDSVNLRRTHENVQSLPSEISSQTTSSSSSTSSVRTTKLYPISKFETNGQDWLQQRLEQERLERIERHRQRRHHFEELARQDQITDREINDLMLMPSSALSGDNSGNNRRHSINNHRPAELLSAPVAPHFNTMNSSSRQPSRGHRLRLTAPALSSSSTSGHGRAMRSHGKRRPKRYCSARDPVQLAYKAPIVIEGKVRSMSHERRADFSVSFEVIQIFKNKQNYNLGKLDLVRLRFTRNATAECDIYQETFRMPGVIRKEFQNVKNYMLFLEHVGAEKFQILGQPILSNQRVYNYVRNATQEKFGKAASIKSLTRIPNRQTKVREKEELRIVCRVRGNPPPKITWFKDDRSIKQSRQLYQFINLKRRSELVVKSFSNATAGLYECRAKNMVRKKVEKKTIRIEAYGRPESHNDTGEDCESSMKAYCLNGGICRFFSDINQYYCKCAEGFEGDRCQEKRPTNVSLNQTVTGYMADSPNDQGSSDESDENISMSEE